MKPIMTIGAAMGAALLASTAQAQQTAPGVEIPSQAAIQSSTVVPDRSEVPEIPSGTQAADQPADRDSAELPRADESSRPADPNAEAGTTESTKKVEEMVEDGEVVDAEPNESWMTCSPAPDGSPAECESDNEAGLDKPIPSQDGIGETSETVPETATAVTR